MLLALAVLTVVVLTFPAPGPTSIDSLVAGLVQDLPGLFGWFWEITYDLLVAWTLVLIALALFAHGRKRLLFEELLAGGLAVGLALVAGWLAGTDWSDSIGAAAASGGPPIYLAVRLALATAVVVMASPYMARPFRYLGRMVVAIGAVAGIALGTTLPIGMVAALAVGIGSAASSISCSAPRRAASPSTRSPTPWPSWASTPPASGRRRWSPVGWPSPPRRRPAGARCW